MFELVEAVGIAYDDTLELFGDVDTESADADRVRGTLTRISPIHRHLGSVESVLASLIEDAFEDKPFSIDEWKTTAVEMCAAW